MPVLAGFRICSRRFAECRWFCRFGFDGATPVKLPISKAIKYVKDDPTDVLLSEVQAGVFRSKLGGLHFGTNNTWVPIMFAMGVASQFTHAPTVKALA